MDFGIRLKSLRDKTGETQVQVGKALGKSRESVKKYEKGERQPDLDSVAKLSRHFNISADYILGITDVEYSPGGFLGELYDEYQDLDEYIRDREFMGYIRLAVKMFVNKLNLEYLEQLIDRIVKENSKNKHTP